MLDMSEDTQRKARAFSKQFFGQELRLAVVVAVGRATEDGFTLSGLAAALAVSVSSVQKPLGDLIKAGLVLPADTPASDRSRPLRRAPSSLWNLGEELLTMIMDGNEPDGSTASVLLR